MKNAKWLMLAVCLPLLVSCGPPRTVTDLKTAIVRLRIAGAQDGPTFDDYGVLLLDAQTSFELAKSALSDVAAAACSDALAKAADAQRVWQNTKNLDDGLPPSTRLPLERLGVAKDDADFERKADGFIPYETSPDDDTPKDVAEKQAARDDARQLLVKQSFDAAGQALARAEAAL